MINLDLENDLEMLEKKYNFSTSFYEALNKFVNANLKEKSLQFLLDNLDYTLSELYLVKKSYSIKSGEQSHVEQDILEVLEKHIIVEVSEPKVTLKF